MDALDRLSMLLAGLEPVGDVDSTNHENAIVLPHLPSHVSAQVAFAGLDLARLQRASKGPG